MTSARPTPEAELLLDYLNAQRSHVLGILDGLDEGALRRAVLPSGWNCLGLLQHLALDDEQFWFQAVVNGDKAAIDRVMNAPENSWDVGPDVTAEQILGLYQQQIDLSNGIIAATPLNAEPAWWPDFFPNFRLGSLREVILHVVTETAVHAGHLDATREIIDGRTWLVLS